MTNAEQFIAKPNRLARQPAAGEPPSELLGWLPEHVSEMDANLAAVRGQSRFGGTPVRITRSSEVA